MFRYYTIIASHSTKIYIRSVIITSRVSHETTFERNIVSEILENFGPYLAVSNVFENVPARRVTSRDPSFPRREREREMPASGMRNQARLR